MRRRHQAASTIIGLFVALGAGVLAAPAAGADDTPSVKLVTDHPNSQPGSPDRAPENYGIALKLFEGDPELWGGAFVDGDVLVIKYANQTLADAEERLQQAGIYGAVKLEATSVSFGALERAQSSLDDLAGARNDFASWGPNYADSSVAIDVSGDAVGIEKAVYATLGAVPATIRTGVTRGETTNSRYYDGISYNGGNAIAFSGSDGWGTCSTSFNLTGSSDGYAYAVSAGHCYQEVNKTPQQRPDVQVFRTTGARSTMGRVWTVSTNVNGTMSGRRGDIAIFRYIPIAGYTAAQMGSPSVYYGNGDVPVSQRRTVKGTEILPQGYQSNSIYTSGGSGKASGLNTGQITPDWISLVNHTVTYGTGFTVNGLTVAEDSWECLSPGDSGGAVYRINTSANTMALGVMSGTNNLGAGTTNCRNYYTPIGTVWFGGTVKTG